MINDDQMEFKIGEDEQAADVEVNDETGEAKLQTQEQAPIVEQASGQQEEELEQYSDKVKKRIDKMTARLREAQRREDAALEYAKNVQSQLNQANQRYQTSDQHRMAEAKSRIETQAVALKQIVRKAREEGDMDTEMEAQERLSQLVVEQKQLQNYEAMAQTTVLRNRSHKPFHSKRHVLNSLPGQIQKPSSGPRTTLGLAKILS
jgi:hypothetical protein